MTPSDHKRFIYLSKGEKITDEAKFLRRQQAELQAGSFKGGYAYEMTKERLALYYQLKAKEDETNKSNE